VHVDAGRQRPLEYKMHALQNDRAAAMILTSRLRLRPHQVADFARYLPLWQQSETPSPGPAMSLSAEEAWARLLRFVGHWSHFGYGLFIVEDLASGELVGEVGCAHYHRGVDERFETFPEAAWRVLASRRQQGIASEAMLAALAWFDHNVRPECTVCMVHASNGPSLKVAARLGYLEFARANYKGQLVVLLQRHGGSAPGDEQPAADSGRAEASVFTSSNPVAEFGQDDRMTGWTD